MANAPKRVVLYSVVQRWVSSPAVSSAVPGVCVPTDAYTLSE